MYLLLLLFIPLLIPFVAKFVFHNTITWAEMAINIVIVVALVSGCYFLGKYTNLTDYEIISGKVVKKEKERVSCSHSYSCNCRTHYSGSGKNRTSYTVCDTCYEHPFDIDWAVYTDFGQYDDRLEIDRVDRQGLNEPQRWTMVTIGEPAAKTISFDNYVKMSPTSLFNELENSADVPVPDYPEIYDYYKVDRAIGGIPDLQKWNEALSNMHRSLGHEARANLIIIFTSNESPWSEILRQRWLGGKKNDVVLILGTKEYPKLSWARVVTWSENPSIINVLRDDVQNAFANKPIDMVELLNIADRDIHKHFVRMNVEKYKYLEDDWQPSAAMMILISILGIAASIGVTWFFHKNDLRNYR